MAKGRKNVGGGRWPARRKFAVAVNAERLSGRYKPTRKALIDAGRKPPKRRKSHR